MSKPSILGSRGSVNAPGVLELLGDDQQLLFEKEAWKYAKDWYVFHGNAIWSVKKYLEVVFRACSSVKSVDCVEFDTGWVATFEREKETKSPKLVRVCRTKDFEKRLHSDSNDG